MSWAPWMPLAIRSASAGVVKTSSCPTITSAGIVLAATFSALAVLPLVFLVQIAFIVAFGVLLDTFVVRSLLVPASAYDIGGPNRRPPPRTHRRPLPRTPPRTPPVPERFVRYHRDPDRLLAGGTGSY